MADFGNFGGAGDWGKDSTVNNNFDPNAEQTNENEPKEVLWLHLRGLPYRCTDDDIIQFLGVSKSNVDRVGIEMNETGRPSGSAYVACNTRNSAEAALSKHRETFPGSRRYVEIFDVSEGAAEAALGGSGSGRGNGGFGSFGGNGGSGGGRDSGKDGDANVPWDGIVKMRGLPFKSCLTDVEQFFSGLTWAENGILFPTDEYGSSTGEAYIQFPTFTEGNSAMERNKNTIGNRYIELFKSNNFERRKTLVEQHKLIASNPYAYHAPQQQSFQPKASWGGLTLSGQGSGTMPAGATRPGAPYKQAQQVQQSKPADVVSAPNDSPFPHVVGIQGLSAGVQNSTIKDFFKPAKATAINILGNGFCDIAFKTHDDALEAMGKDRMSLEGASVNLTLKSQAPSGWGDL